MASDSFEKNNNKLILDSKSLESSFELVYSL